MTHEHPLSEHAIAGGAAAARIHATPFERAAWMGMAAGLLVVLHYHLLAALLAGLLVHALLHRLTGRIAGQVVSRGAAKVLAASLFGLVAVGVTAGIVLLLVGLIRGHLGDRPALFQRMAEVLDQTRLWLERRGGPSLIPDAVRDADQLKGLVADWLRTHARQLPEAGGRLGRFILHAAVGIAVGLLVFFRRPARSTGPPGAGPR